MSQVFVSYSRKDNNYAMRLCGALEVQNIPYFIDQERIEAGEKWPERLIEEVMKSDVFVLIMSPDSEASEWVMKELNLALRNKHRIMPLLLKGDVWEKLSDTQSEDVRNHKLPRANYFRLIRKHLNLPNSEDQIQTPELSPEHRQADLRLLQHLWRSVSSNQIIRIVNGIYYKNLKLEETNVVDRYLSDRQEQGEYAFINMELETAFSEFDTLLTEFTFAIGRSHSLVSFEGKLHFQPHYKSDDLASDLYNEKLAEHRKLENLADKLSNEHKSLVATIKRLYPEFNFETKEE